EGLLKRHLHFAVRRQSVKDAFCRCRIINSELHIESFGFFKVSRGTIRTHQDSVADLQARMHDFMMPFRWHFVCRWRSLVGEHHRDFAAETSLIKFERCLAVSVEHKILIDLHNAPLLVEFDGCYSALTLILRQA